MWTATLSELELADQAQSGHSDSYSLSREMVRPRWISRNCRRFRAFPARQRGTGRPLMTNSKEPSVRTPMVPSAKSGSVAQLRRFTARPLITCPFREELVRRGPYREAREQG